VIQSTDGWNHTYRLAKSEGHAAHK